VMQRLAAEKEKAKTQFAPGASGNPTGKAKKQVDTDSYPPASEPERDTKEKNSRSTVGQIAAAAGVSHHKAAQAVALTTAAATNPEAKAALEGVKAGTLKLKDAVKVVKEATHCCTALAPKAPYGEPGKRDKNGTHSFFGFARTCVSFSLSMGRPTGLEPATPRFTIFRLLVRSYPLVSVSDTPK